MLESLLFLPVHPVVESSKVYRELSAALRELRAIPELQVAAEP